MGESARLVEVAGRVPVAVRVVVAFVLVAGAWAGWAVVTWSAGVSDAQWLAGAAGGENSNPVSFRRRFFFRNRNLEI